jgi:hypothetical protein
MALSTETGLLIATAGGTILTGLGLMLKYGPASIHRWKTRVRQPVCQFIPLQAVCNVTTGYPGEVEVRLRLVNYSTRPLLLRDTRIIYLDFSSGPSIREIISHDIFRVPRRNSVEIVLRRALTAAESDGLRSAQGIASCQEARVMIAANTVDGRTFTLTDSSDVRVFTKFIGLSQKQP